MVPPTASRALLLTASAGCAMTVLDTNIVAMVLPSIARELGAGFAEVEWVVSAYVLCFASLLLPAGSIADRYGRRRVFLAGIGVFAVASLACSAAATAPMLYAARAVQGVGAAFLLAPALAIIGHAFHAEAARAQAWTVWGTIMGLTMVLSPLVGGVVGAGLGWRWAFGINLPACLALALAVLRLVGESRDAAARPLDLPGILLFATGMFCLTSALIQGAAEGWASPGLALRLGTGVSLLAGFLVVEGWGKHPMLDLSLFRAPRFVGAVLAMFAYAGAAQVMASLLPLYLQNGRGLAPWLAGFAMLPFALAMLVLPWLGRRLGQWLPSHGILALGLALVCLGNLVLGQVAGTTGVALGMAVLGSGGGLLNGETQKAIMGSVPRDRAGMASGISTTSRFTGILLGFAGLGAVMAGNLRTILERSACAIPAVACPSLPGFADAVAAGDLLRAVAAVPPEHQEALLQLAGQAYASAFSSAFHAAAALAAVAALLVLGLMRVRATRAIVRAE
jgi:MFS family permease